MGRGLYKCPHCQQLISGYGGQGGDIETRYAEHAEECEAALEHAFANEGEVGNVEESAFQPEFADADWFDGVRE